MVIQKKSQDFPQKKLRTSPKGVKICYILVRVQGNAVNGKKLSDLLERLCDGGSAEDLADKLGVPGQTIRNYISKPPKQPGVDKLVAIANYMDIEIEDLIELLDGPPVKNRKQKTTYKAITAEDGYIVTKNLPAREKLALGVKLVSEAATSFTV